MDPRSHTSMSSPLMRPPYPSTTTQSNSSNSSSAYPSSSSLPSLSTQNLSAPHFGMSHGSAAPVPSPSAGTQPAAYFGSFSPSPQEQQHHHHHQAQMQQQAAQSQLQQQYQHHQHHNSQPQQQQYDFTQPQQQPRPDSAAYMGQRGHDGGPPATAPFLQDFSLLAEAAKRAQMACLARDLGDFGL